MSVEKQQQHYPEFAQNPSISAIERIHSTLLLPEYGFKVDPRFEVLFEGLDISHARRIYPNYIKESNQIYERIMIEPIGDLGTLILKPKREYTYNQRSLIADLNYIRNQHGVIASLTEVGHGPKIVITPQPAEESDSEGYEALSRVKDLIRDMEDRYNVGVGMHDPNNPAVLSDPELYGIEPDASIGRSFYLIERIPWIGKSQNEVSKPEMTIFDPFHKGLLAAARAYQNGEASLSSSDRLVPYYLVEKGMPVGEYYGEPVVGKGVTFYPGNEDQFRLSLTTMDSQKYMVLRDMLNYEIDQNHPNVESIDVSGWRVQDFDTMGSGYAAYEMPLDKWIHTLMRLGSVMAVQRSRYQERLLQEADSIAGFLSPKTIKDCQRSISIPLAESATFVTPPIFEELAKNSRDHSMAAVRRRIFDGLTSEELLVMNAALAGMVHVHGVNYRLSDSTSAFTYNNVLQSVQMPRERANQVYDIEREAAAISASLLLQILDPYVTDGIKAGYYAQGSYARIAFQQRVALSLNVTQEKIQQVLQSV